MNKQTILDYLDKYTGNDLLNDLLGYLKGLVSCKQSFMTIGRDYHLLMSEQDSRLSEINARLKNLQAGCSHPSINGSICEFCGKEIV
jgi:hypothetical protein